MEYEFIPLLNRCKRFVINEKIAAVPINYKR